MTDHADATTDTAATSGAGAVTPAELARELRAGESVSILDLRDRDQFERWGIDGRHVTAVQVPHVRFVAAQATGDVRDPLPDLAEPITVVCGRGEASAQVAGWLREVGLDARNLTGGTAAWADLLLARDLSGSEASGSRRAGEHQQSSETVSQGSLERDGEVVVRQYWRPATGCLSYLVASDGECGVIDPLRAGIDRYLVDAAELDCELRWAVDTHVHADHVSGVRGLIERAAIDSDSRNEPTPVFPTGATDRGLADADDVRLLAAGETLSVGAAAFETIATPGHTAESLAFIGSGYLFSGDALFVHSVGRPDLVGDTDPTALAEQAYETLHERLLGLPDETILAPGHAADAADARDGVYAAPLSVVREQSLLGLERSAFVARVTDRLPPKPANHERIVAANLGQASIDAETVQEIEMGPNHCAVSTD